MFIVAITGGIASGKSVVSRVFEKNGIPVVDADKIARQSKYIESNDYICTCVHLIGIVMT